MGKFKIGDVVQLKSGSPDMTVEKIKKDNMIQCVWFNQDNEIKHEDFHEDLLDSFTPLPAGGVYSIL